MLDLAAETLLHCQVTTHIVESISLVSGHQAYVYSVTTAHARKRWHCAAFDALLASIDARAGV